LKLGDTTSSCIGMHFTHSRVAIIAFDYFL
jgi:hypothetical protein